MYGIGVLRDLVIQIFYFRIDGANFILAQPNLGVDGVNLLNGKLFTTGSFIQIFLKLFNFALYGFFFPSKLAFSLRYRRKGKHA